MKFWDDKKIYLGNQLHKEGSDRCYRIIADEKGEYVSYVGMWWTSENHLAYLEPPCTIPEYRHKGLTAAALSEMYRRTKS